MAPSFYPNLRRQRFAVAFLIRPRKRRDTPLHLRAFASSSRGNCALLYDQNTALLVDAGISCRKIKQRLNTAGLSPEDLSGILITHEHTDHIAGLAVLLKHYDIPLYATPGTGLALARKVPQARALLHVLPAGSRFQVGGMDIQSFSTSHDAADSVGYRLTSGGRSAVIATDLGRVTRLVLDAAFGADLALIESNHDVDWLRDGPYPYALQNRILGDRGHLSNEASGEFAVSLAAAGTQKLLLAHLSPENNTPERARTVVQGALEQAHLRPDVVDVLPQDDCSLCYEV